MTEELKPTDPQQADIEPDSPELAQIEAARLLTNDARDRLRSEGFTDDQIRHWAETYVAQEGGTADVRDFYDWISEREDPAG